MDNSLTKLEKFQEKKMAMANRQEYKKRNRITNYVSTRTGKTQERQK